MKVGPITIDLNTLITHALQVFLKTYKELGEISQHDMITSVKVSKIDNEVHIDVVVIDLKYSRMRVMHVESKVSSYEELEDMLRETLKEALPFCYSHEVPIIHEGYAHVIVNEKHYGRVYSVNDIDDIVERFIEDYVAGV